MSVGPFALAAVLAMNTSYVGMEWLGEGVSKDRIRLRHGRGGIGEDIGDVYDVRHREKGGKGKQTEERA